MIITNRPLVKGNYTAFVFLVLFYCTDHLSAQFIGGFSRGDYFIGVYALYLDGHDLNILNTGGGSRGDRSVTHYASGLNGEEFQNLFSGNIGRGEQLAGKEVPA